MNLCCFLLTYVVPGAPEGQGLAAVEDDIYGTSRYTHAHTTTQSPSRQSLILSFSLTHTHTHTHAHTLSLIHTHNTL